MSTSMVDGWSPPPSPRSPSPWLGWFILAIVVLVMSLGGSWLVDTLDRRPAPAAPSQSASALTTTAPTSTRRTDESWEHE